MPSLPDFVDGARSKFTQISSDAFKSWSRCRRQFYYKHVKRLQWPSDQSNFRLGRDVHKLLDYQARDLDCTLLMESASEDVCRSWEKLMAHPITQLPVLANEWAFHVPVTPDGGQTEWLTGRIDRVARAENKVLVIDWKTGTAVPKQSASDWQTLLYRYAVVEVANTPSAADLGFNLDGPLRPEQVTFLYVEVKADPHTPIRLVEIPYGAEEHEQVRARIQSVLGAMATEEDYALPSQCPDRFCAYRAICGIGE
ncbi:MAG TPA: PD-(D/E)XK nuclease family protein [Coleofasciculaceae cyanobacterium]|jgi:hypothetical protein